MLCCGCLTFCGTLLAEGPEYNKQAICGTFLFLGKKERDLCANVLVQLRFFQAAKLIHKMVRFMPREIFLRLSSNSSVGLFSVQTLPGNVFDEFLLNMPMQCAGKNRVKRLLSFESISKAFKGFQKSPERMFIQVRTNLLIIVKKMLTQSVFIQTYLFCLCTNFAKCLLQACFLFIFNQRIYVGSNFPTFLRLKSQTCCTCLKTTIKTIHFLLS